MRRRTDMERARVVELARDVLDGQKSDDPLYRASLMDALREALFDLDVAEARRAGG